MQVGLPVGIKRVSRVRGGGGPTLPGRSDREPRGAALTVAVCIPPELFFLRCASPLPLSSPTPCSTSPIPSSPSSRRRGSPAEAAARSLPAPSFPRRRIPPSRLVRRHTASRVTIVSAAGGGAARGDPPCRKNASAERPTPAYRRPRLVSSATLTGSAATSWGRPITPIRMRRVILLPRRAGSPAISLTLLVRGGC